MTTAKFIGCVLDGTEMKEIIYSFEKWAAIVKVSVDHANIDEMIEYASVQCKRELSTKVEDFIKLKIDKDRGEVMGTIHLPYIRNEKIKTLEDLLNMRRNEVYKLRRSIDEFNLLPWYKRMWHGIGD